MADKKLRFALMNKYKKRLLDIGKNSDMNMFAQQWAADALIDSFGYDTCLEAIDYYIKINSSPDWQWLTYNMDKVIQSMRMEQDDLKIRAALREGAKKWLDN